MPPARSNKTVKADIVISPEQQAEVAKLHSAFNAHRKAKGQEELTEKQYLQEMTQRNLQTLLNQRTHATRQLLREAVERANPEQIVDMANYLKIKDADIDARLRV